MQKSILECDSLSISFSGKAALKNVSFSLEKGETLGIVGESGSGKSTIIKAIMGILSNEGRVENGRIVFNGENLLDKSQKEMESVRGSQLSMVFQDSAASLCPIRTIGDQIQETMKAHGYKDKKKNKEKAIQLLEKLNFKEPLRVWNSYPFELSGGMNQRVGIALAMILRPLVLLADEPTSALDQKAGQLVIEEIKSLRSEYQTSVIIVSHDISVISSLARNILVLKDGEVMDHGETQKVLNSPESEYTKTLLEAVPERGSNKWRLLPRSKA